MCCFWLILLIALASTLNSVCAYEPNWKSLDTRPLPAWYDEAKFGIFCHWGVFSVPAFKADWFWYFWKGPTPDPEILKFMEKNYKPGFSYGDFAPLFTAELFDPTTFAKIVKSSGAKYYVPTSKHCEGFTNWPSAYSWNWNAVDVGPHRDLIGELREAILDIGGVHFGFYFSQYEWFNRLYWTDKAANFSSQTYVNEVSYPQMVELVNNYKPDILWSDGDWEAADTYWNSERFLAWLFTDSPVAKNIVVNDRWGAGLTGKHGSFYSFSDHFDPGHIVPHKWENCMMLDKNNWMTSRTMTAADVHTLNELITQLARTISCNGNLLLNAGATHDGRIIPIFEERLNEVGAWLAVNGEAVYKTKPWIHQNDSNVWSVSVISRFVRNRKGLKDTVGWPWGHGGVK
uniref:Putative alpha-L-fucosidase n=1 Tax=Plectus sambesii TaxID=2011161 RepID=A0A914X652_9BILA